MVFGKRFLRPWSDTISRAGCFFRSNIVHTETNDYNVRVELLYIFPDLLLIMIECIWVDCKIKYFKRCIWRSLCSNSYDGIWRKVIEKSGDQLLLMIKDVWWIIGVVVIFSPNRVFWKPFQIVCHSFKAVNTEFIFRDRETSSWRTISL